MGSDPTELKSGFRLLYRHTSHQIASQLFGVGVDLYLFPQFSS